MLLARVELGEPLSVVALRPVVRARGCVVVTGDLFLRDADGDYWRVDGVGDVIRARQGPVFTIPIRDALADLEAADLGVAYGVVPPGARARGSSGGGDAPRRGHDLSAPEISRALAALATEHRPMIVQVVDRILVTTGFRPLTGPLREAGIPKPGPGIRAWYLGASGERYRPLTPPARKRLVGAGA